MINVQLVVQGFRVEKELTDNPCGLLLTHCHGHISTDGLGRFGDRVGDAGDDKPPVRHRAPEMGCFETSGTVDEGF